MNDTWVIEREVHLAAERIAQAAKETGATVLRWDSGDPMPKVQEPCTFIGSLNAYTLDMPGLVGNPDRLRFMAYRPFVSDILLNQEVVSGTVGNIPEVPWERVFVRPDSALKPFAGRVLDKKDLNPENLDHGFYYDDLDLPIVLSPAQEVGQEWRFVSVNRQIVTCSTYTATRDAGPEVLPPLSAILVAKKAALLAPEPTVVIDICAVGGSHKLVEFNLFSGSDFYNCDPVAVVQAIRSPR